MSIIRKIFIIGLISIIMCLNCFAVAVSDNDGSAFISKAEFDSLKNTFQAQIDQYNTSIDNKIDSAIASYLSGIKMDSTFSIDTGFVLEGKNKTVTFVGKANNFNNMTNELRATDRIFNIFCGTYATNAYYIQDVYDTFSFEAYYERGNTNNFLAVLDDNHGVLSFKRNVQMNASRVWFGYSTTNVMNGFFWRSITQKLTTPTALVNSSSAYISSNVARGIGTARSNTVAASPYNTLVPGYKIWSDNNHPNGGMNQNLYRTDEENKNLTNIVNNCDVSITGTDYGTNLHWPNGSNNRIKFTQSEWASADLITAYSTSLQNYTYSLKIRNCGGASAYGLFSDFTPSVQGYGVAWKADNGYVTSIYYSKIKDNWGLNCKYSGGFPICKNVNEGTLDITLKSNSNVNIAFTNANNVDFPGATDKRCKKFKYKVSGSTGDYVEASTLRMSANTDYNFKIDMLRDEQLFLTANMASSSGTVQFTQVGDANYTQKAE